MDSDLPVRRDLPVILVSVVHTKGDDYPRYQRKIISGLNHAMQLKVNATHYVYRDDPDLVIKYIKELLMK